MDPNTVQYTAHNVCSIKVGDIITFETKVDEVHGAITGLDPEWRPVRRVIVRVLDYHTVTHGKMSDGYQLYGDKLISDAAAVKLLSHKIGDHAWLADVVPVRG